MIKVYLSEDVSMCDTLVSKKGKRLGLHMQYWFTELIKYLLIVLIVVAWLVGIGAKSLVAVSILELLLVADFVVGYLIRERILVNAKCIHTAGLLRKHEDSLSGISVDKENNKAIAYFRDTEGIKSLSLPRFSVIKYYGTEYKIEEGIKSNGVYTFIIYVPCKEEDRGK